MTTMTVSQWYEGEFSDVENFLDFLYGETGKFLLYVFSYGIEMPAWKEK
jgi:hypothetical protein